ncbi:MAG: pyridoxal phosphate-dependent aminotransferase [Vicinamibacterales bacterium]
MPFSRRTLLRAGGSGPEGGPPVPRVLLRSRGLEPYWPEELDASMFQVADAGEIRIDQNENPVGPGPKAVEALLGGVKYAGRYPTNSRPAAKDATAELCRMFGIKPEHVVLGAGSSEILRNVERAYVTATRPYVAASPSYDKVERFAAQLGAPLRLVPLDRAGQFDFKGIKAAARGAGLVYICSPNNPTATIATGDEIADLVAEVGKVSPDTGILIDEAYHDYVTDPAYRSAIPLAVRHPHVIVARTMSKAHGMAGLRLGYAIAQPKTIERFSPLAITFNTNVIVVAASVASLRDPAYIERERTRNSAVRELTMGFFKRAGYSPFESHGNFMFVDVRQPTRAFREECARLKVLVGRPFPPLDKTHVRISFGTMEEMKRAIVVFGKVLGVAAPTASVVGRSQAGA